MIQLRRLVATIAVRSALLPASGGMSDPAQAVSSHLGAIGCFGFDVAQAQHLVYVDLMSSMRSST